MANYNLETVLGMSLLILSCIYGSCIIYYAYKFYNIRNEIIYMNRRGNLVIAGTVMCMIVQLIGFPLVIFLHWNFPGHPNTDSIQFLILDVVNDFIYGPFYYFGAFIAILRYYLIYYDIQFSHSCSNLKWKQFINSNLESLKKEQWYMKHRSTLGNQSFMLKRVIVIGIFICLIMIVLLNLHTFGLTHFQYVLFLNGVVFATLFVFLAIIFKKMPLFNDNIYLYKECQLITYFWLGTLCVYAAVVCLRWFFGDTLWIRFSGFMPILFANFIISFLSTYWVLKQIDLYEHFDHGFSFPMELVEQTSISVGGMSPRAHSGTTSNLSLVEILSDDETLNLFMQHLIKEFSMECILSTIEMLQFRNYAIKSLDINEVDVEDCVDIHFPDSIPQSEIVYSNELDKTNVFDNDKLNETNDDMILKLKIKAYKLYEKYIASESDLEINISYRNRKLITELMDDYDEFLKRDITELDLIQIFDREILEMCRLLNHSKTRFEYIKI
eukprot:110836_1